MGRIFYRSSFTVLSCHGFLIEMLAMHPFNTIKNWISYLLNLFSSCKYDFSAKDSCKIISGFFNLHFIFLGIKPVKWDS